MSARTSSDKYVSIQVPTDLQEAVEEFVKSYGEISPDLSCAEQLHQAEQKVAAAADQLLSDAMQSIVQQSVTYQESASRSYRRRLLLPPSLGLAALPKGFKNQGRRSVSIRLCRGNPISVRVTYFSRNCDRQRDRRGCYLALERLGIFDRCSPTLASHAALTLALSASFAEARQMLQLQGVCLNVKTLANIAYRFAARARENLAETKYRLPGQANAEGMRLVVALDGGRVRLRQAKRGKRRASGRHGYHAPWREPKLLYIYAIDEEGKKIDTFKPIVDGTFALLADSEEIFVRLQGYLSGLQVDRAKEVIFIGDGAPWVSNRVPKLLKDLKLAEEKVRVVVDFYHAVEHLKAAAEEQKKWTQKQKKAWIKKQRRRLYQGAVGKVIEEMERHQAKKGTKAETEKEYFAKRQPQMAYASFRKAGVPIGSGAVESAIRRIVNLRLKGAGIFWLQENAEHVLLLRCYAKAGRWSDILSLALRSHRLLYA